MIRVQTFPCPRAKAEADARNRESGRHYTTVLMWHYRIYRRTGHWLSEYAAKRLQDCLGGPMILHAHSRDAAQEGCYAACKVAKRQQRMGLDMRAARYAHRRPCYRTTTWKTTEIRVHAGVLLLARSRGLEPMRVTLPDHLRTYPATAYKQVELVWDQAGRRSRWHVTLPDGTEPAPATGSAVVAVDLGEIHPAAMTDGTAAVVVSARRLHDGRRAACQYTVKRVAALGSAQDRQQTGSRRWKRLQARKNRCLAEQKTRTRDIAHTVSRAVVDCAVERQAGMLARGDVRDVAAGTRMSAKSQQKIGRWSHGNVRQYITSTAQAKGIRVARIDEHDTSKTCPR